MPASESEFGRVFRRCENAASTTCLTIANRGGSSVRRNATSAESTFGGGRNTVRATGWKPVRSAASCTSTDTAPYAFVEGEAKNRSATSRCTITHHSADRRQAVEALGDDRRGDVVGQIRDELGRGRLQRGEVEGERVAPVQPDVRRQVGQARLERAVELDGVDVPDAVGEVAGEHAEARPDLEHDVVCARARRGGR